MGRINHVLSWWWLELFLMFSPWFRLFQGFHVKGGSFSRPPTSPNRCKQDQWKQSKYLIQLVTRNSEYLTGCRNEQRIAFLFLPLKDTLLFGISSFTELPDTLWRVGLPLDSQGHHVLWQVCKMHRPRSAVAVYLLHRGQYPTVLSQWGNQVRLWGSPQPLCVVLLWHCRRRAAGE